MMRWMRLEWILRVTGGPWRDLRPKSRMDRFLSWGNYSSCNRRSRDEIPGCKPVTRSGWCRGGQCQWPWTERVERFLRPPRKESAVRPADGQTSQQRIFSCLLLRSCQNRSLSRMATPPRLLSFTIFLFCLVNMQHGSHMGGSSPFSSSDTGEPFLESKMPQISSQLAEYWWKGSSVPPAPWNTCLCRPQTGPLKIPWEPCPRALSKLLSWHNHCALGF